MAPKKSAWATQVDDEEASGDKSLAPLPEAFASEPEAAFPSLGDAAKVVETKAERKKKQAKMSLADFNSMGGGANSGKFSVASVRARTQQKAADDILLNLPRAPRADRPADEAGSALGGGFRDYGGNRGGFGDRDDDRQDRRRSGFGDRDRDDDSQGGSDDGPSRADMADDWGASRKFTPSSDDRRSGGGYSDRGGFADREPRRGGFGDRDAEDDGPSRADAADDWGTKRTPLPAEPSRSGGAFGDRRSGGFADRDGFSNRRESDLFSGSNRADEVDTWGRSSAALAAAPPSSTERDSWGPPRRTEAAPPSGERKRLQLAPRTLPPPEIKPAVTPEQVEASPEPPAETPQPDEAPPQPPKPRANPFGAARPREVVLAEKSPPRSEEGPTDSRNEAGDDAEPGADVVPASKEESTPEAAGSAPKEAPSGFTYAAAARKQAEEADMAADQQQGAELSSEPAQSAPSAAVEYAAEELGKLST